MSVPARHMRIRWGGASDRGLRRAENQDAMYADIGLFVVADGMGGHLGGSVASSLAVKTVAANSPSTPSELLAAVRHANQVVHHRSNTHADLTGMGTTLCAIAVVQHAEQRVWCLVNVGDSRVYRYHGGELVQLTIDHNFVAELVRAGDLTVEQAAEHPRRNTLTRAVGVEPDVKIDDWVLELSGNDRFLLCTDGITNELEESDIRELLDVEQHPSDIARSLVRQANDRGGRDNSTALVVDVDIAGGPDEPVLAAAAAPAPRHPRRGSSVAQRTSRRRGRRRTRAR
ncbi:PP2C family protein-serine/threonine phosphatase [Candidatus Poriferisodalis sp.]|uniref:PP2C family protein-serine/threonine phosphatase n=1 Tax=Candidatus Poriferisodalis sp. TaxID=3101277 RepID=UPI003B02B4FE